MRKHRKLTISDPHFVDRDLKRPDRKGVIGLDLIRSFLAWVKEGEHFVLVNGDGWNYTRMLAEDLGFMTDLLSHVWDRMVFLAGNHDQALQGVSQLGYGAEKTLMVTVERKTVLSTGHEMIDKKNVKILTTHGDLFDAFWDPRNGKKKRLMRWIGNEVIKRGYQAEELIHPRIDDWVMGAVHKVMGLSLKRGSRLPREAFLSRALQYAQEHEEELGFPDEIVTGHLHDFFDAARNGVRCINTNSWVPSTHKSPDGLFKKNELCPGVYDWEAGILYRWTPEGLVRPRRNDDGSWCDLLEFLEEPWTQKLPLDRTP